MSEYFILDAPKAWQYELSVLVREVYPFAKVEAIGSDILNSSDWQNACLLRPVNEENQAVFTDKNACKRALLKQLLSMSQSELPWGILTGVRPSKVAYDLLEAGHDTDLVARMLQTEYLLRGDKARLCARVALSEQNILKDHDGTDVSIYVGIPFCPTRCAYCSFISNDAKAYHKHGSAYVEALCKEIRASADLVKGRHLQSFYMGGGTPTTLSPLELSLVLEAVDDAFGLSNFTEITVESGRPDTMTKDRLQALRDFGVDRISVNPQTMNQKTLDLIGRKHQASEIPAAFCLARDMGFSTINMDFIVGLPGETPQDVRFSMQTVLDLCPENLTVHTLAIKRSSRLNEELDEDVKKTLTDYRHRGAMVDEMLSLCAQTADELGLNPYYMYRQKNMAGNFENVGYSLPGHEGRYNVEIMEERQSILALGAGGVTKLYFPAENRLERICNVKTPEEYVARLDEMIERKIQGGFAL